MPFRNRKKYLRIFSVQCCHNLKKYHSLCKSEIQLFRHFPELKIAYFNGKKLNLSSAKFYSKYFGLLRVNLTWMFIGNAPDGFVKKPRKKYHMTVFNIGGSCIT